MELRIINNKLVVDNDGRHQEIDLGDYLNIDDADISQEYIKQAGMYAFLSELLAAADRDLQYADMAKDQAEAESDAYWRDYHDKRGEKYTEGVIKADIKMDEDCIKSQTTFIERQYNVNLLKALVNSMKMKADMLISLGAQRRSEYDMTGMRVNQSQFDSTVNDVKEKMRSRKQRQV